MALFFANYGYHPTIGIKLSKIIDKTAITQKSKLYIEDANKFVNKMNKLHYFFCKEMTYA